MFWETCSGGAGLKQQQQKQHQEEDEPGRISNKSQVA